MNQSTYLNISHDSNNGITLTFRDDVATNFSTWAPMIEQLTNPAYFTASVSCTSAISGQYGFLPRLLYYLLLVFAVILRHRTWLATAAVATAMSYASTAAVHIFILFVTFHNGKKNDSPVSGSDTDLYAAFLIVSAGAIMLPPIQSWCRTVRENEAWLVVFCWGLLQFTASLSILIVFVINNPWIYIVQSFALCRQDANENCGAAFLKTAVLKSQQFYEKCQCIDYCGSISTDIPLRKGQNYQAWLAPDSISEITWDGGFEVGLVVMCIILILALLNGFFSLLESRWTQIEIRNWIYWKLSGNYLDRFSLRIFKRTGHKYEQIDQDRHLGLAKGAAAVVYLYTSVMTAICIPFFITTIVVNEINVRRFPVGESSDAVGQWATWVGASLVLLAAIIQDYKIWFRYFIEKLSSGTLSKTRETYHSWSAMISRIIEAAKDFMSEFRSWWRNPAQYSLSLRPSELSQNIPPQPEYVQLADQS